MSSETMTYCKKCGKDVAFKTQNRQTYAERGGKAYSFRRKVAVCPKCGNDLEYEQYDIAAAKSLRGAVKRGEGLVTRDQILEFPRRYAIGKRPLSLLLGWGELTYTRLVDGRMPSKEHSDEIQRYIYDPAAFTRLLEAGKANGVITDMAYTRSKRAVSKLMGDASKALFAEYLIVDRLCVLAGGDITPRALQVLVYYVQGWGTVVLDGPLFRELPSASPDGPVYAKIRNGYTYAGIQQVVRRANDQEEGESDDAVPESQPRSLTDQEIRLVDAVYERYGRFSGPELVRMACSEAPWRKARKRAEVPDGAPCDEPITLKSMKKYFSKHPDPIKL